MSTPQVVREMFHAPESSLHLYQKGGVVTFMFLQLTTGVGDNLMFSVSINLGENGPKAPGFDVIAQAGIRDEGIRPVPSGVGHDGFGHQAGLKLSKGFESVVR